MPLERRSGETCQPWNSWPLPALSHWEVEVGGTRGSEEERGAKLARDTWVVDFARAGLVIWRGGNQGSFLVSPPSLESRPVAGRPRTSLETFRGIDIARQMEAGNHGAQVSGDVNASTAARPDSDTASSPIWLAFAWGLASAASLPVGAILAIYTRPREKLSANLMAFGGGSFPHPPACCAYCVCPCAHMTRGCSRL